MISASILPNASKLVCIFHIIKIVHPPHGDFGRAQSIFVHDLGDIGNPVLAAIFEYGILSDVNGSIHPHPDQHIHILIYTHCRILAIISNGAFCIEVLRFCSEPLHRHSRRDSDIFQIADQHHAVVVRHTLPTFSLKSRLLSAYRSIRGMGPLSSALFRKRYDAYMTIRLQSSILLVSSVIPSRAIMLDAAVMRWARYASCALVSNARLDFVMVKISASVICAHLFHQDFVTVTV
nr:MAG TPA_asm: hypothetical protein [Caudoviricetes sp.]